MRRVFAPLPLLLLLACAGGNRGDDTAPVTDSEADTDTDTDTDADTDTDTDADTDTDTDTDTPPSPAFLPQVGPDPARCAPPVPAGDPAWTYVCDCRAGTRATASGTCTPGDDVSGDGRAATPFRSLARAVQAFDSGTGKVALCRGGVWNPATTQSLGLQNPACSPADPCTLADYGDPSLANPVLEFTTTQVGFEGSYSSAPRRGFELRNLRVTHDGSGAPLFAFNLLYDIEDLTFSCMEVDHFAGAFNLNALGRVQAGIVVQDSYIHDQTDQGWLGACDDCGLRRNLLVNNGLGCGPSQGPLCHTTYFSASNRGFLQHNHIQVDSRCQGTVVNNHGGTISDLVIEGNIIESTEVLPPTGNGCWGIGVDNSSSLTDVNQRAQVRQNVVRNLGNRAISLASCVDCVVENNVVVQGDAIATTAIGAPSFPAGNPGSGSDPELTGLVVRHNSLYLNGGTGIELGDEGSGHRVENNIVQFTGGGGVGLALGAQAGDFASVTHNLVFGGTFDAGTTGLDPSPFTIDPQHLGPPDDLRLAPASPAIDAGAPAASPALDLVGTPRTDGQPDLGALEAP